MTKIIPAILPDSYRGIELNVTKIHNAVDTVQIDFVDGNVAPHRTWLFNNKEQEKLSAILSEDEGMPFWDSMNYEFDLMVKDPLEQIDTFIALGPSKIIFHVEQMEEEKMKAYFESLPEIVRQTVKFGVALNIDTDPQLLIPYTPYIETIQCMGIDHIGAQGQPFDEKVLGQIEKVRGLFPDKEISVDGGVTLENATELVQRGVTTLVVGSVIFQSIDPQGTIKKLKEVCKQATTQ